MLSWLTAMSYGLLTRNFSNKGVALFKFRWPAGLFAFLFILVATAAMAADPVNVKFFASSAPGASPLKETLNWVIEPINGTKGEKQTFKKARFDAKLVPGYYKVTVTMGMATVSKNVSIDKPGKQEIVMNVGYASFRMIPSNKAKSIQEPINWTIYRFTKGGVDEKQKVGSVVGPNPQVTLPAGFYTVRGQYDAVRADMVAEIKAGVGYKYTVNLYAGKAALSAAADGKAAKGKVNWKIMKFAKDKKGVHETIYTSNAASPTVMLREGTYMVVAQSGEMAGEGKLVVTEGKTAKLKVDMKKGVKVASGS
jgi:hypothetical protein